MLITLWKRCLRRSCRASCPPLVLVSLVLSVASAQADTFLAPVLSDVEAAGIRGSLVICGGGELPDAAVQQFRALAGGEKAQLVVIPTASQQVGQSDFESHQQAWRDRGFQSVRIVHTRDRTVADSDDFLAPLKSATAVWFAGGQQRLIAEAYVGTRVEAELTALLDRGGVIGGTSAGAAIQSRLMIASGNPQASLARGFDLVPGAVIDQHFKVRNRQPRLTSVLSAHPGYFGLGIDEGTGVIVRGRTIAVVGDSTVTVCLSESANRPARSYEIPAGRTADLTALRRAAIARSTPPFPPSIPPVTRVNDGALMIVGGGAMNELMWRRFVELAGGSDSQIVCVPSADEKPELGENRDVRALRIAGAKTVTLLHTTSREEANRDEFFEPLRRATGVWFGGGRQWRLVDAYEETETGKAFQNVLRRGGVIGGSSAGATIQGDYLVRGNPLGNRDMMAEGYERGFGFLPGAAIDQHFSQRNRQSDMDLLMQTFPQLLGIGIDESTAIVVQGATARVIGANDVHFYDGATDEDSDGVRCFKLSDGDAYDLQGRARIE